MEQIRGFGSPSITTPVSLLANEFDVRSILHVQVSLAAVDQICVTHEAMKGCKNVILSSVKLSRLYITFVII